MPRLTRDILSQLIEPRQYPCISIYMPVMNTFPGEMENNPRFENLLKRAREQLNVGYPPNQVQNLIDKCRSLVGEREFWTRRLSGLAIFCSPDFAIEVDLPRTVPEQVMVADSFHAKPLIRLLQTMDRCQVLCLTRKDVRLLEGDRDLLEEVPLKNAPKTSYEAFNQEVNPPGARRPLTPVVGAETTERWFRSVDKAIWENHSRKTHLPLVLCALPENQNDFRRICKNEYLIDERIELDPDHVPLERIRLEAWKLMEPKYQEKMRQALDNFRAARAHHAGAEDVFEVAKSAAKGKVDLLLIEDNRHVGGRLDPDSGQVLLGDISDPMLGDLLDDTAETVLRRGGRVVVMPPGQMPTRTGMAAVYRY